MWIKNVKRQKIMECFSSPLYLYKKMLFRIYEAAILLKSDFDKLPKEGS